MRIARPSTNLDVLPYSTVKINGCSETNVEFTFLAEQPAVGKRRYCNKILVHECVIMQTAEAVDLASAEFMASSDNCYKFFEIYKSSEILDAIPASIELVSSIDGVISILVKFTADETCCLPTRLAYRLYGFLTTDNQRVLLAQGNLLISPCAWTEECTRELWTEVVW